MLPGAAHKDSDLIPRIMRQLWVFLAYIIAARLAIMLAPPPGYASPIWPAAGLGMAAVILWGPSLTIAIFLGSIATNLRPDELAQNPLNQIMLQSCLALGSSLQAYLGSLVFQGLARRWPQETSPRRVSLEIIALGPITCMTAATVGIAALTTSQVIEGRMILSNWISWWLGDSFGAGIVTPILVRLARNFQPKQVRLRALPYLLATAALNLLLVGALVVYLTHSEQRNHEDLKQSAADFHQRVQKDVDLTIETMKRLAEYSRVLDPKILLERHGELEKDGIPIFWVPRIPLDSENTAAEDRLISWPLMLSSTPQGFKLLPSGLDLGSLPEVEHNLQLAWESSTTLSSPLLTLGQDTQAILLIQRGLSPTLDSFQQGLFVALIPWEHWLKSAAAHHDQAIFQVKIQANGSKDSPLFAGWFGRKATESHSLRPYAQFKKPLALGSQTLTLQVDFPAAAFHNGRMGDPTLVTLLCMALAFTFTILIVSQQHVPTVIDPQRKTQQDEGRVQYEALRDADRSKAQLLANISHQIRSPLQGILGLLDMLRGSSLDKQQRRSIETIMANCHSMRLMLDDIHTYASMEADELALASDDFLIEECIRDLTSVYEIAAEEEHNEFKSELHLPAMLRVHGDRGHIHRVLSHLLSDAIRRTQKGRIIFHVSLQNQQRLLITIESQRGQVDEVHDNEWEFGNVKAWQSLEIFNLKICERIVQAMGGGLVLDRPGPLLSRVTLTLPLPMTQSQDQRVPGPDAEVQDVLVVDDNAINLTVASGLLAKLGYRVETAANGPDALERIKKKRYDVIFMDCQMPDMDGYEATQRIRAFHKPERGPWIFALSANTFEGAREKAMESGMDSWLVKPISLDILVQTIGYARTKPAAPIPPRAPVMDFKAFSTGLGDDQELIQTAVQRYFEEIDDIMLRLRRETERNDATSVARTAHTLKGLNSLFAANDLVAANLQLEIAAKEDRKQDFSAILKNVENLTELLKNELRRLRLEETTTKDVA